MEFTGPPIHVIWKIISPYCSALCGATHKVSSGIVYEVFLKKEDGWQPSGLRSTDPSLLLRKFSEGGMVQEALARATRENLRLPAELL